MTDLPVHYPNKQKFELKIGTSEAAILSYRQRGDLFHFDHTFVPPELRGKGAAAQITNYALLEARRLGWKVIPDCSYVENYIEKHPEFKNLLAEGS